MVKRLAVGVDPLNQTPKSRRIKPVPTLATIKKGSTPPGLRIGVKKRGGR